MSVLVETKSDLHDHCQRQYGVCNVLTFNFTYFSISCIFTVSLIEYCSEVNVHVGGVRLCL
jgi:hypothetical protein